MPEDILSLKAPPADQRVAYGTDPNQFIDLRIPQGSGPFPLAINIHGGFWRARYDLLHAGHLCAALTGKGIATANLEYRRAGNEGGGWPGTFADIRNAYSFLRLHRHAKRFDARQLVVMGHSSGGQLALCLAAHEPSVSRVVSLAGVLDLECAERLHLSNDAVVEFLHGTPAEVPEHYREADPKRLSIPNTRQWIVCGMADDIVPPSFSRDYVAEKKRRVGARREDVNLLEILGADHFDVIDPRSAAWRQVEETVLHLLN